MAASDAERAEAERLQQIAQQREAARQREAEADAARQAAQERRK